MFRIVPFVDGSRYKINEPLRPLNSECTTSTVGSEKFKNILAQYFEIMTKRKRNYESQGGIYETAKGFKKSFPPSPLIWKNVAKS